MAVYPVSRLDLSVPLSSLPTTHNNIATNRQIVMAVQQVNQSELLEQNRELIYRRDVKTGHMIVQTVNRDNGDVVDQIPLEALLRMQAEAQAANRAEPPASTDSG
jgi:uncharacterized FlaG/YvyC family protein